MFLLSYNQTHQVSGGEFNINVISGTEIIISRPTTLSLNKREMEFKLNGYFYQYTDYNYLRQSFPRNKDMTISNGFINNQLCYTLKNF